MEQWRVCWVDRTGRIETGFGPVWTVDELRRREQAAGIRQGSPFMTRPDGSVDPILTLYFNSLLFQQLAETSKVSYTADYRVFLNFLSQRGSSWLEATARDLEDFEDWRRRAPANPRLISGSKWLRELSALNRLYRWAVRSGFVENSPLRTLPVITRRDGRCVERLEAAARDVRSSNVKWLTPRAARRWRDVGLLGWGADGLRDPSFRGRNGDRNAAYADLLFDSGLRRSEAASLLTLELPAAVGVTRYQWTRVAREVAKYGSGRPFCIHSSTLRSVRTYIATSRAQVIERAQKRGYYDKLVDKVILHRVRGALPTTLEWFDPNGQLHERALDRLTVDQRRRLFIEGPGGVEPLWLWLSEDGLPFAGHSWEAVFRSASDRCSAILGERAPFCRPHMARHSFALQMLLALHHALDSRFELDDAQRRDFELLYGNPWRIVKDLLGHRSEETTRNVYLAPVRDLQVKTLLEGELQPGVELLQALAALSGRVLDVADE